MRFTEFPPINKALHRMLREQAAATLKLVRKDIAAEAEKVKENSNNDYLDGYADGLARAREMLDAMIAGLDLAEVAQRGEDR